MVHRIGVFVAPNDFDLTSITREWVHFAVWLRLPFRIRTGKLYRFRVTDNQQFEIWIHNRLVLPGETDFIKSINLLAENRGKGWSGLWSEAVVFFPDPYLKDDTVKAIQQEKGTVPSEQNLFRALAALNQFICAYATGTNQLFGGAPLRMLTDMEFFECLDWEMTFLSPPAYEITDKDIEDVFNEKPDLNVVSTGGQLTGDLNDLPLSTLAGIDRAFQNNQEHAFYEIAFKAKTEMVARDPIVAIVLACAALEGVHAEFLRQATKDTIKSHELVTNLLREQGIYTLIQVTPRLFIPEDMRPSDDLIKRCAEAITTRNGIMHAKRSKRGQYHVREYTGNQLNSAYSALMEMYNILQKFLIND